MGENLKSQTEKSKREEFVVKSDLKSKRGWTDKLIKTFLPAPDLVKKNPYYRKASDMQLFLVAKVETIEQTEEFKEMLLKTAKRKEGAKKAVETKLKHLKEYIEEAEISLDVLPQNELIRISCDNYNENQSEREYRGVTYRWASPSGLID